MGVDEVMAGLQSENVNTPLGRLNRERLGVSPPGLRETGRGRGVQDHGDRPAQRPADPPGRGAEVRDGIEEQRSLALVNGVPAVSLDILKQSGANTVEVVDAGQEGDYEVPSRASPGNDDRGGPRRLDLDPGFGP